MIPAVLQYATLAAFAFGAMAFTWLAWSYWRGRRAGGVVFRMFTLVCASAFAANLLAAVFFLAHPVFDYVRGLLVGVLPPMMLHLVLGRAGGRWRLVLAGLYLSVLMPDDGEVATWRLGAAALMALSALLTQHPSDTRHRTWNVGIFAAFLASAAGALYGESPLFDLLPDYLLLLFLAVWLYYRERLAFFDVFLKGGLYFLTGAVGIGLLQAIAPGTSVWALFAVWLVGPLALRSTSAWIDRRALRRRYSPVEAERAFAAAIQACGGEDELEAVARGALREIFNAEAELWTEGGGPAAIEGELRDEGIRLAPRANGIPFLSGDRTLLETLARTLHVVRENLTFRQQQQALRDLAARAEVRALRAQINPHFLFNALNAIAGWIRRRPDLADETVTQLAEVFRYALNRSQQEWVRLGEEVEFLRSYLAVEQARFGDRLAMEIRCDQSVESAQVPAMLIQPLVENAMKHGVAHVAAGARVALDVRGDGGALIVEVSDNGPGFPAGFAPPLGHGLRNVADRLRGYFGDRATLQWENTPRGCRVRLQMPGKVTPP